MLDVTGKAEKRSHMKLEIFNVFQIADHGTCAR